MKQRNAGDGNCNFARYGALFVASPTAVADLFESTNIVIPVVDTIRNSFDTAFLCRFPKADGAPTQYGLFTRLWRAGLR